jgi:hypothetical protein
LFHGCWFGFENFYPTADIRPIGDASRLFYNWSTNWSTQTGSLKQRLEECGVVLDTSKATVLSNAFAYCGAIIKELPTIDCTGLTASTQVFRDGYDGLSTIEKVIVNENTTFDRWFYYTNIKNITFEGVIGQNLDISYKEQNSKKSWLSADSIRNIIEHLSDTASGKTLTLSNTAVNNAFTTDAWNALIATKSNWTITLA